MTIMKKLKNLAEWLEHGKTVVEILVSLGAGKAVQALLVQFAKIPPIWETPISLLTAAGVMALLVSIGNKYWRKPSPQSTLQSASNVLVKATTTNLVATEFFRVSYNSSLQSEIENNFRAAAIQNQPNDHEGFLLRLMATGLVGFMYDSFWAYIYRSQILLLMQLNRRNMPLVEAKTYYDKAAIDYPDT
jgi:hypothetical protein